MTELALAGFVRNTCTRCGCRFFTRLGLSSHRSRPCQPPVHAPEPPSAVREQARRMALEINAIRRRCLTCGKEASPGGLGVHQKYSGHTGWEVVA